METSSKCGEPTMENIFINLEGGPNMANGGAVYARENERAEHNGRNIQDAMIDEREAVFEQDSFKAEEAVVNKFDIMEEFEDEQQKIGSDQVEKLIHVFLVLPYHEREFWENVRPILESLQAQKGNLDMSNALGAMQEIYKLRFPGVGGAEEDLEGLYEYLSVIDEHKRDLYTKKIVPFLAEVVLYYSKSNIPFQEPWELIIMGREKMELGRLQCTGLLAMMFFGLVHSQKFVDKRECTFAPLFGSRLLVANKFDVLHHTLEMLFVYFEKIYERATEENGAFERLDREKITFRKWAHVEKNEDVKNGEEAVKNSMRLLREARLVNPGWTPVQANKFATVIISKNVLGGDSSSGFDARWFATPELLIVRLLIPKLLPTEVAIVVNAEQYSEYDWVGGIAVARVKEEANYEGKDEHLQYLESNVQLSTATSNKIFILVQEEEEEFDNSSLSKIEPEKSSSLNSAAAEHSNAFVVREIVRFLAAFSCKEELEDRTHFFVRSWDICGDMQLRFFIQWMVASYTERGLNAEKCDDVSLARMSSVLELLEDLKIKKAYDLLDNYCEESRGRRYISLRMFLEKEVPYYFSASGK